MIAVHFACRVQSYRCLNRNDLASEVFNKKLSTTATVTRKNLNRQIPSNKTHIICQHDGSFNITHKLDKLCDTSISDHSVLNTKCKLFDTGEELEL